MNVAVITLSPEGVVLAERLIERFPDWRLYAHVSLAVHPRDQNSHGVRPRRGLEAHAGHHENTPKSDHRSISHSVSEVSREDRLFPKGFPSERLREKTHDHDAGTANHEKGIPSTPAKDITPCGDQREPQGTKSFWGWGSGGRDFFQKLPYPGKPYSHESFSRITDLTREIFAQFRGLVYIAPCGVVVRALAPNLRSKLDDPAVVVVDVGGRYAVSLLSGHEGGANELALAVANTLAAEPVISTTTEARKRLIVGVGCRRGTSSDSIVSAIRHALAEIRASEDQVRLLASADIKAEELGLLEASKQLGIAVRFIPSEEIRSSAREFAVSRFVEEKVNLPAVAEPAALLAGRRTRLILPKRRFNGVTVAVAQEDCVWSE
ncbi:MAG: cobalamin biosynthesis protein [Thermodesulfobacteriota bacterium]